ncbi:uncharacterized protein Z520_01821 [Fonsecaea multimorphosa CBS 102226]|uniref:Uncharacterized protein n=1 Tax=Fonsecaea multimorphosa CBS 102226 TaxID=1442371 RepID=A0A0D2KXW5_9EURO|nr:uncharacterized protein Z520_01821 [Fonsecaea multimorphosa CBS 102226]KIY01684.1 hypothetical protein Z520_01821 [Fonsecaea multimorphosa CBS 102226]OAL29879.1 hypothetical protein AYO22_01785 [Fonsecaea multimorphosa]
MVAFTKFAAAAVLMTSFAAAAPVRTPDSLDARVECMSLGCTTPDKPHRYVGGAVHLKGSDVFPPSSDKVEDLANSDADKILVKFSIVDKPLEEEAALDQERQDPEPSKRDLQEHVEQEGVNEAEEANSDADKILVKFSIVKKPLEVEAALDQERQDPDHGKRDFQKHLEQEGVDEAEEAVGVKSQDPDHGKRDLREQVEQIGDMHSRLDDFPALDKHEEAARPGSDRSPLEKAEDRLLNGLEHLTHEKHESAQ